MFDASLHLAPNVSWLLYAVLTVALGGLAWWAYRVSIPPLPALARRVMPILRLLALAMLLWLLAEPVLERPLGGAAKLVALLDRSRSMELAERPGGETRAQVAERALQEISKGFRGSVEVVPFDSRLGGDTTVTRGGSTALGDALADLSFTPQGQEARAVVVVSDGAVNAGQDPVAAARALGVPVHALAVGRGGAMDRSVTEVEASVQAQVGRATPVRVRLTSTEPRGGPLTVRLLDGRRELARASAVAPGSGAETMVEFRVAPVAPGLAVWTAVVDSVEGELSTANNARQVAFQVAPGRLGVMILSEGLNWDLTFFRRALSGDSSLKLATWVRERRGWRSLEGERAGGPSDDALRQQSVLVLDGVSPAELGASFDRAVTDFVRAGGGVLCFGGSLPGLSRFGVGALGTELGITTRAEVPPRTALPDPVPEARELLAWDDDAARGDRAWREAAPLSEPVPLNASAGDRVLVRSLGGAVPLLLLKRIGRGQALLVNGAGTWRWSLSSTDDLGADRGRRLWRGLVRWLAEPVQAEPLRVRPERWLTAGGEKVRLFATLQDGSFRPVAGARVTGEVSLPDGRAQKVEFAPQAAGSYVAELSELPAGRYTVVAEAVRGGTLGRARAPFAVDPWSLEESVTAPDSVGLGAIARATGGHIAGVADAAGFARTLETRGLARGQTASTRLREWPVLFAVIVGLLSIEWAWRRRRGLP